MHKNDNLRRSNFHSADRVMDSSHHRFELTTSVVIGTDCIGSCKFNDHMTTTTPDMLRE